MAWHRYVLSGSLCFAMGLGVPFLYPHPYVSGPHKMHPHTVHLALGALLIPCTTWRTGASPLPLPHLPHRYVFIGVEQLGANLLADYFVGRLGTIVPS